MAAMCAGGIVLLVRAGQIYDGMGGVPLQHGIIAVADDGSILSISQAQEGSAPDHAEMIDWSMYTVLTGLVDSHTHLFLSSKVEEGLISQGTTHSAFDTCLRAVMNVRQDFESGVTTARGLADMDGLVLAMRKAIDKGWILGPRLVNSYAIRPGHGTGVGFAHVANGVDEVRRAVREGVASGVEFIKIFATNTVPGEGEDAYRRGDLTTTAAYTEAEIRAAIEEAHRAEVKVAVHALGGPGMRWALEGGADTIEHANLMEEEDIDLFLRSGAILSDPNLQLFFDDEMGYELRHFGAPTPDWWRRRVSDCRDQTKRVMSLALSAGVPIALGSDPNHGELWREAVHLVGQLGATTTGAIDSVTRIAARAVGLSDRTGTLEAGKSADLVAVAGDPFKKIEVLRDVRFVMKQGVVHACHRGELRERG